MEENGASGIVVFENAGYDHRLVPVARVDVLNDPDRTYGPEEVSWRLDPRETKTHYLTAILRFEKLPKDLIVKHDYILQDTEGRKVKYHGVWIQQILTEIDPPDNGHLVLVNLDFVERLDGNETP